ncbi:MAG: hypothetical protein LC105_06245 [Chitinophagales bacterium]|nr:hypothetical protein [Chitinophagales bacterium]
MVYGGCNGCCDIFVFPWGALLKDLLDFSHTVNKNIEVIPNNEHSQLEIELIFFLLFVLLLLMTKPVSLKNKNIQQRYIDKISYI